MKKSAKYAVESRAKRQKTEDASQCNSGKEEEPKAARADVEREQEQGRKENQTEQPVAQMGEPGTGCPNGTEQTPEYGKTEAEGDRPEKLNQLGVYGQIHPNSRAQKPPSFRDSS